MNSVFPLANMTHTYKPHTHMYTKLLIVSMIVDRVQRYIEF